MTTKQVAPIYRHQTIGVLDDALDQYDETQRRHTAERRQSDADAAARDAADRAAGQELVSDFLRRVKEAGLRPDRTLMDTHRYDRRGHNSMHSWNESYRRNREVRSFEAYHLGGLDSRAYLLTPSSRRAVLERDVVISGKDFGQRIGRFTHYLDRWVEQPVLGSDSVSTALPDDEVLSSITLPEAMARYLRRG